MLRDLTSSVEREFPIPPNALARSIEFCPDGRSVVLGGAGLYRVPLDRGGAEPLVTEAIRYAVCVGTDVIYIPTGRVPAPNGLRVVRRSLVSGEETELYHGMAALLQRSPDGQQIAFVQVGQTEARLVVMPVTGGNVVTVATAPIVPVAPGRMMTALQGVMWLPDGKALLVARVSEGSDQTAKDPEITLWRIPLDGPPAREAGRFRLPAFDRAIVGSLHYSLHPDGTRLAFERHAGFVAQVWAIDNLMPFIKSGAAMPPVPRR